MLKCSYIVYVHNNEESIFRVIDSLTKINGNFRREFIIIDDGSTDDSLFIIKDHIKSLPRATVITQDHAGSAVSINKALSLVKSDYVHFVNGAREVCLSETSELVEACIKYDAQVAFYSSDIKISSIKLLEQPLKEILIGDKIAGIRNIGSTSSLVSYNLLMKTQGADEEIYTIRPSLAIACASFAKFVCIYKQTACERDLQATSSNFNHYNDLLAVYNFMKQEPQTAELYINELMYNLYKSAQTFRSRANYFSKYLTCKYLSKYCLDKVKDWYQTELKKLF